LKLLRILQKQLGSPSIIKYLEKLTASKIYTKLPHGCEPAIDIQYRFQTYQMQTIFDVGANIGQSAIAFRENYPNSAIYSFEPVKATFEKLKHETQNLNIQCFNYALGKAEEKAQMLVDEHNPFSVSNALVKERTIVQHYQTEQVQIKSLDLFTKDQEVTNINYLKIDTEGNDLNVLKGSKECLSQQKIDFVEAELGMNPYNQDHVPFADVVDYLRGYKYHLFGIYEQLHDFKLQKPILRRCNTVFISERMMNQ